MEHTITLNLKTVNGQSIQGTGNLIIPGGPASTSELPEGTNLYLTTERVQDIIASTLKSQPDFNWYYNDATGELTLNSKKLYTAFIESSDFNIVTELGPNFHSGLDIRLFVDTSTASVAITLPPSNIGYNGTVTICKTNAGGDAITILRGLSGDKVMGDGLMVITSQYSRVDMILDNVNRNWHI